MGRQRERRSTPAKDGALGKYDGGTAPHPGRRDGNEPPEESEVGGTTPLTLTRKQKSSIRVLVVDDEASLLESLASVLEHEGYKVTACSRGVEAEERVRQGTYDIILLDLYMTGVPGTALLEKALEVRPDAVVLVITGKPSVESSIEALRMGAWDYLPKPFSATHLQIILGRAAHTVLVSRDTQRLQEEGEDRHWSIGTVRLLGESPSFHRVMELARKVARTDAAVFITGESGTGKEMVAQFIHEHSRRSSRELVAVNCAAIPESLLESEMFGHVQGAFTGAVREKPGLMEEANGGTLLLDELAEMSMSTQAKLLRVIQDGVVRRVGSTKTDAVVNVRFIAATNRDPGEAVRDGSLREDLYYRLRVVPIHIPPLRERPEDIEVLIRHFLQHYWSHHHESRLPAPAFSSEAIRELQQRPWKGNVRELENVIEHAVVMAEPGQEIGPEALPSFDDDEIESVRAATLALPHLAGEDYHSARDRVLTDFERRYLTWVLQEAEGNMSEAARIAGVDRTTLYRLLDKHNLEKSNLLAAGR